MAYLRVYVDGGSVRCDVNWKDGEEEQMAAIIHHLTRAGADGLLRLIAQRARGAGASGAVLGVQRHYARLSGRPEGPVVPPTQAPLGNEP